MTRSLVVLPDRHRVAALGAGEGIVTFNALRSLCEPSRWRNRRVATATQVRWVLHGLASQCLAPAYGNIPFEPALAAEVHSLIAALRTQEISAEALEEAGRLAGGRLGERILAFASLMRSLDRQLESQGLIDPTHLTSVATERLASSGIPAGLSDVEAIQVQSFHDFAPERRSFLRALTQAFQAAGREVRVFWPDAGEAGLFVRDALAHIERNWADLEASWEPRAPPGPLMDRANAVFEGTPGGDGSGVSIVSLGTPRDEAEFIAREVKRSIVEGIAPQDLGVCMRQLTARNGRRFRDALHAHGVAVRAMATLRLATMPSARVALDMLELAGANVPIARCVRALESQNFGRLNAPSAARLFAEAGVREGLLGSAGKNADQRLAALAQRRPELRQMLEELTGAITVLRSAVAMIPGRGTPLALLAAWRASLRKLCFRKAPLVPEDQRKQLRWAARHAIEEAQWRERESFRALAELLRQLAVAWKSTSEMTLQAFTAHLRSEVALRELASDKDADSSDGVWLFEATTLPGRAFTRLFMAGMRDGRFPALQKSSPLLTNDEQVQLNAAAGRILFQTAVADGGPLVSSNLSLDRFLFHCALASAKTILLTYARRDDEQRETQRSPFLDAVESAFPSVREQLIPHKPWARLDDWMSEGELRTLTALEGLSPRQLRFTPSDGRALHLAKLLAQEDWAKDAQHVAEIATERHRSFTEASVAPSRYTGRISGPLQGVLAPSFDFPVSRPLSAKVMDGIGRCRFVGWVERVLDARPPKLPSEEADARLEGLLRHSILARVGQCVADGQSWDALDLVAASAAAEAELMESAAVGNPLLWRLTVERVVKEIAELLSSRDAVVPNTHLRPWKFEVPFGRLTSEAAFREVEVRAASAEELPIFLTGRIDRIDSGNRLAAIDYKTRIRTPRALRDGLLTHDFQMPMYLYALARVGMGGLPEGYWIGIAEAEMVPFSKVLGEDQASLIILVTDDPGARTEARESGRANLANALHLRLAQLRGGAFDADARDCGHCEYAALCRIPKLRDGQDAEALG